MATNVSVCAHQQTRLFMLRLSVLRWRACVPDQPVGGRCSEPLTGDDVQLISIISFSLSLLPLGFTIVNVIVAGLISSCN
jgi:hypothetical protein